VVDESKLRRGKPTANALWGNQASVLVGDFLYSQAFQMMVGLNNFTVFNTLARAIRTIAEGEILQLQNCHNPDTTEAAYLEVIRCKTGTLFAAAAQMGAILCERSPAEVAAMADYGLTLGTAFQLVDDALDYCADTQLIGKNIGNDLAEGKPTLPLIYALKMGTPAQQSLIRMAISQGGTQELAQVLETIATTKAIEYTYAAAKHYTQQAKQILATMPESTYHQALLTLADFALERCH
jgi:octaprenyl-diphosphate synthase